MIKITGLEELQNKLAGIAKKAEELDGQHNIPVSELLTESFLSRHTSFSTAEEMLKSSGFKTETDADLAAIPVHDLDNYIRLISSFDSWQSMLGAAGQEWAKRKLGL